MVVSCPKCGTQYEIEKSGRYECECGCAFDAEVPIRKANETRNDSEGSFSQCDTSSTSDTKICPFCGKIIKRAATMCRFCNNSLSQLVVMCEECGSFIKFTPENLGKKMTCPACGELLLVQPAKDRICPCCGETVKFEAKVCKFCHASLPPLDIIDLRGGRIEKSVPLQGGCALPVSDLSLKDKMSKLWANLKLWAILGLASLPFAYFGVPLIFTAVAVVFFCIYLYQLLECYWRYVGPEKGYTSGQMAGFNFIPFFNLYWIFVCYGKLVRKINQANANAVNESYAMMYCISMFLTGIPIVGLIFNVVMFFILHSQLNQAFVGDQR